MRHVLTLVLLSCLGLAGCGDDTTAPSGGAGGTGGSGGQGGQPSDGGGGDSPNGGAADGGAPADGAGGMGGSGGQGGSSFSFVDTSCFDEPPPGAVSPPPPKAYTGGTCPALVDGYNEINSGGNTRSFRLALPSKLQPEERLPVIFLWHWLGGSADDFYERGEVQTAVDTQRFIAVIPVSKGDQTFQWPFDTSQSQARMDEEFTYFDDMLSCVSEQYNVIPSCVSSVGVSAGALFTDQLAGYRSDYLASFVSLSGGVGGLIKPWAHPAHALPGLVLWGGSTDTCIVINFEEGSHNLEQGLNEDGNFYLECVHSCGHSEPPFVAPEGQSKYAGMWQFAFDHPYWLEPGQSPYADGAFPAGMPEWCGVGPASAPPPPQLACDEPGC